MPVSYTHLRLLKDKVKEILEDSGMGELANDK